MPMGRLMIVRERPPTALETLGKCETWLSVEDVDSDAVEESVTAAGGELIFWGTLKQRGSGVLVRTGRGAPMAEPVGRSLIYLRRVSEPLPKIATRRASFRRAESPVEMTPLCGPRV